MEGKNVFDTLVSDLGVEERKALLEKLKASEHQLSREWICEVDEEAERVDIQGLYQGTGFWERVVCLVTAFFTRRKPLEVYEGRLLRSLQFKYESIHPGIVDFRRGVLGPKFYEELQAMKVSARFFYTSLESCVERDRPAFYAYLGSTEMAVTHERLMEGTDVYRIGEANPFWDNQMILRHCLSELDGICDTIGEDERARMYRDIRSLFCLRRLGAFGFDHFLSFFRQGSGSQRECSLATAEPYLADLADILYSFQEPPSIELLESVFMFANQDLIERKDEALEADVKEGIEKTESALGTIRKFISTSALLDLIRACRKDLAYRPKQLSGGEDWFSVYKGFWKARIEDAFSRFARERSHMHLVKEVEEFLGQNALKELGNLKAFRKESGFVVKQELLLSFILSAFDTVFVDEINRPLKILLLDGEFYRSENRIEYTDAYSVYVKTSDSVKAFDRRLAKDGDLGILFSEAQREFSSIAAKQYKLQQVSLTVSSEADKIIQEVVRALKTGMNVLKGILYPEQGSRYDSLQNLRLIEGKQNPAYLLSIERVKDKLEKILTLIRTIAETESIKTEL